MLCSKCGTPVPEHGKFCPVCGATMHYSHSQPAQIYDQPESVTYARQADTYAQETSPGYDRRQPPSYDEQMPYAYDGQQPMAYGQNSMQYTQAAYGGGLPAKKNEGLWWKIAIPTAAVAIAAALVLFFTLSWSANNNEDEATQDALLAGDKQHSSVEVASAAASIFSNNELAERLDGTPFAVLGMLFESIESGSLSVNISHRDFLGMNTGISLELLSDMHNGEIAAMMDILTGGMNVDLEIYLNEEALVFGSSLIPGNSYYGITFATLQNDLRVFANAMGIDMSMLDTFMEIFDMFDGFKDFGMIDMGMAAAIEDFASKFADSLVVTSERAEIGVGDSTVGCTKIDVLLTKDAILALLDGFSYIIEDAVSSGFGLAGNPFFQESLYEMEYAFTELQWQLDELVRAFQLYYSGDVIFTVYISDNSRLLRIEFDADMSFDGELAQMGGVFDFGASATDRWTFDIFAGDQYSRQTISLAWDYSRNGDVVSNTLSLSMDGVPMGNLSSSWDTRSGGFVLSARDAYFNESTLTGTLLVNANQFTFRLDDLTVGYNESLSIEVSGRSGNVTIPKVDYINLDRWSDTLMDVLDGLANSGFGVGGIPYEDAFDSWN